MDFEGLDIDSSMLDDNQIENLFGDPETEEKEEKPAEKTEVTPEKDETKPEEVIETKDTTEVNPDDLFDEPEKVGGGKDKDDIKDGEDTKPDKVDSTPPNKQDFFSSIADALADEGIFPDLDDEKIKSVKNADDLRNLIDETIKGELTDKQKRIDEALSNNVEPNAIKGYEDTLTYLDNIDETKLSDESDEGSNLRSRIIYQDLINRGFSKEKAAKSVKRSFDDNTDIEDAKDALQGNKDFYASKYQAIVDEAKQKNKEAEEKAELEAANLRDSILDSNTEFFDGLKLDKKTREKVFDSISKPVYRDPKTGYSYTEIQKFDKDNHKDFMTKLGVIFTLTNGFKNLDGLVKDKVNKEVKRGFSKLESKINNTSRTNSGNLKYASGEDDSKFILDNGFTLDV